MANLNWKPLLLRALLIVTAGVWVFSPALHGDWLWDDGMLVSQNKLVHDPAGLWKIWFSPDYLIDYQPIKVSVEWLEWQFLGDNTLGYHLTSVVLHLISSLLIWRLLSKFGLRLAWLGGLLFAIHPVMVESVAWIAELKNTLSLPPFLLAMCAYLDYDQHGRRKNYFLALGLFLVAMLCKTSMVMFPVVVLLHAWWKRSRIGWNDLKASAPFFAVSLVMGLVTVWFLKHHTMDNRVALAGGFFSHVTLAGVSLAVYFSNCVWPIGLLPLYPKWPVNPWSPMQILPWPILIGFLEWCWIKRASWGRHVLLGFGFFLINLVPFVGFTTASYMSFTWVMDHLLYIPIIGLIGLATAELGRMETRLSPSVRPLGIGVIAMVMALLAFESHGYAEIFVNEETLWTYTLERCPMNCLPYNNLGGVLLRAGRISEARERFEQALQINPRYDDARYNRGVLLQQTDHLPEAMEQYRQTLQINPDYAEAYLGLGNILLKLDRPSEAMEQYKQALRIRPHSSEAYLGVGNSLFHLGRTAEAMVQYKEAVRLNSHDVEGHTCLGITLAQMGRLPEAMEEYKQALRLDPPYPEAHLNLGNAFLQTNRPSEAMEQYEQALQANPKYAEAYNSMGAALVKMGRLTEALEQYGQAARLNPQLTGARNNMGIALFNLGRIPEAKAQFEAVLQMDPHNNNAQADLEKIETLQKTTPVKN